MTQLPELHVNCKLVKYFWEKTPAKAANTPFFQVMSCLLCLQMLLRCSQEMARHAESHKQLASYLIYSHSMLSTCQDRLSFFGPCACNGRSKLKTSVRDHAIEMRDSTLITDDLSWSWHLWWLFKAHSRLRFERPCMLTLAAMQHTGDRCSRCSLSSMYEILPQNPSSDDRRTAKVYSCIDKMPEEPCPVSKHARETSQSCTGVTNCIEYHSVHQTNIKSIYVPMHCVTKFDC